MPDQTITETAVELLHQLLQEQDRPRSWHWAYQIFRAADPLDPPRRPLAAADSMAAERISELLHARHPDATPEELHLALRAVRIRLIGVGWPLR